MFCDGTSGYVFPPEPVEYSTVTLRFRTGRDDVDHVRLVVGEDRYEMKKERSTIIRYIGLWIKRYLSILLRFRMEKKLSILVEMVYRTPL